MTTNNCATCEHSRYKQCGHCYMFETEPESLCAQHTVNKGRAKDRQLGASFLMVALAAVMSRTDKKDKP